MKFQVRVPERAGGGLGGGDYIDRGVRGAGLLQATALGRGQDVRIGQGTGGRDLVVGGDGDRDVIVTEFEGELARAQELGVMPALIVRIDSQTREPLGGQEDAIAVLSGLGET